MFKKNSTQNNLRNPAYSRTQISMLSVGWLIFSLFLSCNASAQPFIHDFGCLPLDDNGAQEYDTEVTCWYKITAPDDEPYDNDKLAGVILPSELEAITYWNSDDYEDYHPGEDDCYLTDLQDGTTRIVCEGETDDDDTSQIDFKARLRARCSSSVTVQAIVQSWYDDDDFDDGIAPAHVDIEHTQVQLPQCPTNVNIPSFVVFAETDRSSGNIGTDFTLQARVAKGTQPISEYSWDLGDGRNETGQTIQISYPESGLYEVTLTVTTPSGESTQDSLSLAIFDSSSTSTSLPVLNLPDLMGDVNDDGRITLSDAHQVAKHVGRVELLDADSQRSADFDFDGSITYEDARLISLAVIDLENLPNVLLQTEGAPGLAVTLISPHLRDLNSLVEIEVGNSSVIQKPERFARGYANFLIPFDPTTPGSLDVTPGPIEIRLFVDNVLVDTYTFKLSAPEPLSADPIAEVEKLFDDLEILFAEMEKDFTSQLDDLGLSDEDKETLLIANVASRSVLKEGLDELRELLTAPGAEQLAEIFLTSAQANGLQQLREELDAIVNEAGGQVSIQALQSVALASSSLPAIASLNATQDPCDALVPALCDAMRYIELVNTGTQIISVACDTLLALAVGAILYPGDGPLLDIGLVTAWLAGCAKVELSLRLTTVVFDILGTIDIDFKLEAEPKTLSGADPNETASIRAIIQPIGTDELCGLAAGQGTNFIAKKLGERLVGQLMNSNAGLRTLKRLFSIAGEDIYSNFLQSLSDIAQEVVTEAGLDKGMKALADSFCSSFVGTDLITNGQGLIMGPTPNSGTLTFLSDGTGQYMCPMNPSPGDPSTVMFSATKDICGKKETQTVEVSCQTEEVTITIGDNGSLNDDIFEVQINGRTVLTSNAPARSISTTESLPAGRTTVRMIGRAAPDGIGTYFINFTGARVVGGDATSGSDLTPGTVKVFIIEVGQ